MTTEKVANDVKQISLKAAAAACHAANLLGAADVLMIAGAALLIASQWIRSRIKAEDHLKS